MSAFGPDLGAWNPYLDEPALLSWYELPPALAAERALYSPSLRHFQPLMGARFEELRERTEHYAAESVAEWGLPYHNQAHFGAVERAGMAAVVKLGQLRGEPVPEVVAQALSLALLLHDCHHPGATFRADAVSPARLWRPELGTAVATEWISALAADAWAQRHDLTVPWRLFQTQVIYASTYGGSTPRGQDLGIPDPRPQGLWGCLMRAADVCPPADFRQWMRSAAAVLYGEIPASPAPLTWDGFLHQQNGFTHYIEHCFDRLDAVGGCRLTAELGWRAGLRSHRRRLGLLQQGRDPELEQQLRLEVMHYGVAL